MKVPIIDRLLHRTPPDDDRVRKDADVIQLVHESAATLRRVDRLVRVARVDAEIDARRGKS